MKNLTHVTSPRNEKFAYVILSAFLWIGAVCAGYFFEVAFLLLDAGLFLGLAIWLWLGRGTKIKLGYWHFLLIGFLGLYWLSCSYAVDTEAAILEASRFSSILPIAILTSSLSEQKYGGYFKQWAWAGAFLTVWGWGLNLYRDGRLESSIGYANTLGIILFAGLAIAWQVYKESKDKKYLFLLVIQCIGLIQTSSRTVMFIFVVACLIELLRLKGKYRWIWLLILSSLIVLVGYVGYKSNSHVWSRLSSLNWNAPEFMTRRIYWTDGFALFRENWIFGLGGGGWVIERPSWYSVKYLHQFYLQMVLEVGIGGLLVLGAMILFPFKNAIVFAKTKSVILIVIIAILFHVAFDLDFEYPLCFGLFIMLLARLDGISSNGKRVMTSVVRVSIVSLIIIAVGFAWVAVGYGMKSMGARAASDGRWEHSGKLLIRSSMMMPWSHTLHFELAKKNIAQGNSSHEQSDYNRAYSEIRRALALLPSYEAYYQLKEKLRKKEEIQRF